MSYLVRLQYSKSMTLVGGYPDTESLYVSTDRANYYTDIVDPCIKSTLSLTREMFSGNNAYGASRLGYGTMELANGDGHLDALLGYGFHGFMLTHYTGLNAASGTTLLYAIPEQPESTLDTITFRINDGLQGMDNPLLTTTYAGSNSLPNGLEGTADDLKGTLKPRAYGKVYNISPPQVNTARLIFQVSDKAVNSVDAVYDRGAALTKGADYTSQSDMETNAPAAGNFRAWPAGGYFRLGSSPAGQITADVVEGANAAARTAGQIMYRITDDHAFGSVQTATGTDRDALDAENSAEVGIFIDSDESGISVLDKVAAAIGAFYYGQRNSSSSAMRFGYFAAPSGTASQVLNDTNIIDIERVAGGGETLGIPAAVLTLRHSKNYTPQTSDLAGAVTDARRAWLAEEYRAVVDGNADVRNKYAYQKADITRDTLLISSSDAATEAARLADLFCVDRENYLVTIPMTDENRAAIEIGQVVSVTLNRFGLGSGKLFNILRIEEDHNTQRIQLSLWG